MLAYGFVAINPNYHNCLVPVLPGTQASAFCYLHLWVWLLPDFSNNGLRSINWITYATRPNEISHLTHREQYCLPLYIHKTKTNTKK